MRNKWFVFAGFSMILLFFGIRFYHKQKEEYRLRHIDMSFHEEDEEGENIAGAMSYYQLIKADPQTGEINPELVTSAFREADRVKQYRGTIGLNWKSRGPDNYGGRTRGIVIDKDNPDILVAGGVSGGIYRSVNGGKSWTKVVISDAKPGGLVVSCMEQASDGTIYFGTGEMYFTAMSGPNGDLTSGSRGGGVYKSTDKGVTWTFLDATDPAKSGNTRWYNVQAIKSDPTNPNVLYAATYAGFMKSTDAGATWTRLDMPDGATTAIFIDIAVSNNGQTVFTASYAAGRCKLFRSINGAAFEKIAANVNEITNSTRLTIAIAPSDQNYIYVVSTSNGTAPYPGVHSFGGLYRSKDNGTTWEQIVAGHAPGAEPFGSQGHYQGQYDNLVAVDPFNKDRVFVGGVTLYCYKAGQFYKIASSEEYLDAEEKYKNPLFVHVDMHNIRFDLKSKPEKMYIVTDGGIYVSNNWKTSDYPTYSYSNNYYTTTQYYGLAVDVFGNLVGGTQDQSSMYIDAGGLTGNSAHEILGGDGFYAEISKYDNNIIFYESQEGRCVRSANKGKSYEKFVYDYKNQKYVIDDEFFFNTPFRLWENKEKQTFYDTSGNPYDSIVHVSKCFVAGNKGIWMTPDAVDFNADTLRWYLISKGISNQQILHLEYTSDGDAVFVGTRSSVNGRLYRISGLKGKKLWFDQNGNFDPDYFGIKTELIGSWSNRSVCGIGVSPSNDNVVVVTLGNYVTGYDHVYISNNALDDAANVTWTSLHTSKLPHMPIYDAAINSQSSSQDTIILATELGIWATVNGGTDWYEENEGMARVPTFMLRQIKRYPWWRGYAFYAGTFGMGIMECTSFVTNVGIKEDRVLTQSMSVFPNPVQNQLNIRYILDKPVVLTAQIINLNGQVVKKFTLNDNQRGENNQTIPVSGILSGTYLIRLTGENTNLVSKFNVIQ